MSLQKIMCALVDGVRWLLPRPNRANPELTQLFQYHPFVFGKTHK
jgi:hypothetical protein